MKLLLLASLLFCYTANAVSVSSLYTYTTDKKGIVAVVATGCDGSDLARVNGAKKPSFGCSDGYSVTSFQKTKTFSTTLEAIEFSITPKAGYTISLSSISGDFRRSNSGTMSVRFAYSTGNGKWIDAGVDGTPKSGSCGQTNTLSWDFKDFTSSTTIAFRIYGFNASSSTGVLQLLNINVVGSAWVVDADGDGYAVGSDCNDNNPSIHPNAVELCNNTDDNCDGSVDEGLFHTYYGDADGDKYGNSLIIFTTCSSIPTGYVSDATDCNDANSLINPGIVETCNGIDDNCNGQSDEGVPVHIYYPDANGDGYIDEGSLPFTTCISSMPKGYSVTPIPKTDITITTTTHMMNRKLHGYVGSDLSYESGMKDKNVFTADYLSLIKGLNVQDMSYPDGAMDDWNHLFKPGYGCNKSDFTGTPNKYEEVGQGICTFTGKINFNDAFIQLCDTLHSSKSWVFNMQSGSIAELNYAILNYKVDVMYMGNETSNPSNNYWCADGNAYIGLTQFRIDSVKKWNANVKCILDIAPPTLNDTKKFNSPLPKIKGYDGWRAYIHAGVCGATTGDPVKDLASMGSYLISTEIPLLKQTSITFNGTPAYISQVFEPHMDNYPVAYQGTMVGALICSKYTTFAVNQQAGDDDIACMNIMSLKYLIDSQNRPKAEYWAELLAGKLFMKDSHLCTFSTSLPGIEGCASSENGHYVVFIRNETGVQVSVAGMLIDGCYLISDATSALFGTSLKDSAPIFAPITESVIKPYSVTTFEFDLPIAN